MTNSTLKSTLVAAAIALSFCAAPVAASEPAKVSRDTGVGQLIAAQGNAALRLIRAEVKAAVRFMQPALPARPAKVSAPAGASVPMTTAARCAE